MTKAKILVVEDEAIIAQDIKRRLEKKGYEVSSIVATGRGAVRKVKEDQPSLVLMDIVLPGEMDGVDAAAVIRSEYDLPVVYLTAYSDEAILRRAIQTEPFGYITKPFEDSDLYRTIEMGLFKHRLERELRESEKWFSTTLRSIGEALLATDRDGAVTFINPAAEELFGWKQDEGKGRDVREVVGIIEDSVWGKHSGAVGGESHEGFRLLAGGDHKLVTREGEEKDVTGGGSAIADERGNVLGAVFALRDITTRKTAERELKRSREELKAHVEEVREKNTALKVLLEQREKDRAEIEERIMTNIRNLILPYIDKLKTAREAPERKAFLSILESNLEQITSSFSKKLSSRFHSFTPQEIRIANLVKEGRQDKEIMEILNISFETVKSHRQNIRKKLGIYGKRENLRSYLTLLAD